MKMKIMTEWEYEKIKDSGMFWEFFPAATGIYKIDMGEIDEEEDVVGEDQDDVSGVDVESEVP